MADYIIPFEQLGLGDVGRVGGKNASLGEMIAGLASAGVRVPPGFATTADAYRDFLKHEGLDDRIKQTLAGLDTDDLDQLAQTGDRIR
ncbi:MAG: phosphoenolpyruvate synthase, partial [Gammaproteobacteria bacterium]|nr:phosphoenolpyruvate synthase [Gammaproteobacteria bacterium]